MGLFLVLLLGIVLGGYLVLFSYNNTQQVSLNLLGSWYLHEVAIWQLVVACLAIGALAAAVVFMPAQLRSFIRLRSCQQELAETQALLQEESRRQSAALESPTRPALKASPEAPALEQD